MNLFLRQENGRVGKPKLTAADSNTTLTRARKDC